MVRGTDTYGSGDSDTALLSIDENAIEKGFAQVTNAVSGKPSTRRRDSVSLVFERFLQTRVADGPTHMITAQPNDVVAFLCWLDSCLEKIRTVAHARDCEAVGTSELSNCSTTEEGYTLRYAHDSLRTNYVTKLAMAYERDLGHVEDVKPDQKRSSQAVHGLRKGRAEKGRSRSITSTNSASKPPRDSHRTYNTSHQT